jgi:hypothetical protein
MLEREAEGVLESPFPSGIAGVREQRAIFRVLAEGDPTVDAAFASAMGRSPLPRSLMPSGHRSQTKGAVLHEAAALPRLSDSGGAEQQPRHRHHGSFALQAVALLR